MRIDNDEQTEQGLDTDDILAVISDCSDSEDEEPEPDVPSVPAATPSEARTFAQGLMQFIVTNMKDCTAHQELLNSTFNQMWFIDVTFHNTRNRTQSSITNFFKPS